MVLRKVDLQIWHWISMAFSFCRRRDRLSVSLFFFFLSL